MRHTEHWTAISTLLDLTNNAYRDLHHYRSNQLPQNVESELLPIGHQIMPHRSDAKSTSHGKKAWPHDLMYLESTFLLYRGQDHLKGYVFPSRSYASA